MQEAPRLSHVGLYVHDVAKMIDFYTEVLGFVVSDGALWQNAARARRGVSPGAVRRPAL